jgi:hypothetical protein
VLGAVRQGHRRGLPEGGFGFGDLVAQQVALDVLAAVVQRVRSDDPETLTALTGWSALWLYGLVDTLQSTVELTTNHARRAPELERVGVRRSRTLSAVDVTQVDGLPVVTVARLFCDVAGSVKQSALRGFLLDARQRRLVTSSEIRTALERAGNIKAARMLRMLLEELSHENADSVFEHRMRRRLMEDGFHPDPGQAEVPIEGGRILHVDIPFSNEKVGIECHGLGFHADRKALETDAKRQSELNLTDWIIVIATWRDLEEGWPELRERLRRPCRPLPPDLTVKRSGAS